MDKIYYQRKIDDCTSKVLAHQKAIEGMDEQILINNEKIDKLVEKHDNYIKSKDAVNRVGSDIIDLERKRKRNLSKLNNVKGVKFIEKYYKSVDNVHKGNHKVKAYNSLDKTLYIIQKKINNIKDEIDKLEGQNSDYSTKIRRYKREISDNKGEIERYKTKLRESI